MKINQETLKAAKAWKRSSKQLTKAYLRTVCRITNDASLVRYYLSVIAPASEKKA